MYDNLEPDERENGARMLRHLADLLGEF
jgi:hypothetical protein